MNWEKVKRSVKYYWFVLGCIFTRKSSYACVIEDILKDDYDGELRLKKFKYFMRSKNVDFSTMLSDGFTVVHSVIMRGIGDIRAWLFNEENKVQAEKVLDDSDCVYQYLKRVFESKGEEKVKEICNKLCMTEKSIFEKVKEKANGNDEFAKCIKRFVMEEEVKEPVETLKAQHAGIQRQANDPVRIAFFGETCVGKSSLINMLLDQVCCTVSDAVYGCTKYVTSYELGKLGDAKIELLDTPGYDKRLHTYFKEKFKAENDKDNQQSYAFDIAVFVLNPLNVTENDEKMIRCLIESGKQCRVVFNKSEAHIGVELTKIDMEFKLERKYKKEDIKKMVTEEAVQAEIQKKKNEALKSFCTRLIDCGIKRDYMENIFKNVIFVVTENNLDNLKFSYEESKAIIQDLKLSLIEDAKKVILSRQAELQKQTVSIMPTIEEAKESNEKDQNTNNERTVMALPSITHKKSSPEERVIS